MKRATTEEFIVKARLLHGERYDYSKVEYSTAGAEIQVICREHGSFFQRACAHLQGQGCPRCGLTKGSFAKFLEKARIVHGEKYTYPSTEYKSATEMIDIVCSTHGVFRQTRHNHVHGHGCPQCGVTSRAQKRSSDTEEFTLKATTVHGDRYDYSRVNYESNKKKVEIVCKDHGSFFQQPISHLQGVGCPACGGNLLKTTEDFITMAKQVHGDTYDYSQVDYRGATSQVRIICKKHGIFLQKAHAHLTNRGCLSCNSSKGELRIKDLLIKQGIPFSQQKRFTDCRYKSPLPFDFFVNETFLIEFDGVQHFKPFSFGSDQSSKKMEENFAFQKMKDGIKSQFCEDRGFKLYRISYLEDVNLRLAEILKEQGLVNL